jgi:hypothetical protein
VEGWLDTGQAAVMEKIYFGAGGVLDVAPMANRTRCNDGDGGQASTELPRRETSGGREAHTANDRSTSGGKALPRILRRREGWASTRRWRSLAAVGTI